MQLAILPRATLVVAPPPRPPPPPPPPAERPPEEEEQQEEQQREQATAEEATLPPAELMVGVQEVALDPSGEAAGGAGCMLVSGHSCMPTPSTTRVCTWCRRSGSAGLGGLGVACMAHTCTPCLAATPSGNRSDRASAITLPAPARSATLPTPLTLPGSDSEPTPLPPVCLPCSAVFCTAAEAAARQGRAQPQRHLFAGEGTLRQACVPQRQEAAQLLRGQHAPPHRPLAMSGV